MNRKTITLARNQMTGIQISDVGMNVDRPVGAAKEQGDHDGRQMLTFMEKKATFRTLAE